MVQRVAVCVKFPDNVKDQLNKWGENVSLMSYSLMTLIVIGFTVATFIQCRNDNWIVNLVADIRFVSLPIEGP